MGYFKSVPVITLGVAGFCALGCEAPTQPVHDADLAASVVAVDQATEISIKIAPAALVLGVEGSWVTVHTSVRYGSAINSSLALNGIPAVLTYADDRGYLVVKFRQADVEAIVLPPEAILTLTGEFTSGGTFFGTDTILVRERKKGTPKGKS